MYLKDFTLRDFGANVYQDARLDNLEDGLIVIGGPQRAGKTTFLQALRRIGHGIEKDADLPPAADDYELRATINHDGHDYILKVDGHGEPAVVSMGDGPSVSVQEVFGGVSKRQYEQLFTITLDELKRLPDTVDSAEDISEILLGAAYGDVAVIPELQSQFKSRAYEIGRKRGKPTKKSELRPAKETIDDGIQARDEANQQVEDWADARQELDSVQDEIGELKSRKRDLEHQAERLEVLDDEYEAFVEYRELSETLNAAAVEEARELPDDAEREVEELISDYEGVIESELAVRESLAETAPDGDVGQYKEALLEHEDTIEELDRQLSRWESEAAARQDSTDELRERRGDLKRRLRELYTEWDGDFERVLSIQTDAVAEQTVEDAADDYADADDRVSEAKRERENLETTLKEYEDQYARNEEETASADGRLPQALLVGLGSLTVGIGGSILGYVAVAGIASALLLGSGLYVVLRQDDQSPEIDTAREIQANIERTEADLESAKNDLESARDDLNEAESTLEDVKRDVGLPSDIPVSAVLSFYTGVQECQRDIRELLADEHEHAAWLRELVSELEDAEATISEIRDTHWDDDRPLETLDALSSAIETAHDDLEDARQLAELQSNREALEQDILEFTSTWRGAKAVNVENRSSDAILEDLREYKQLVQDANGVVEDANKRDEFVSQIKMKLQSGATEAAFTHEAEDGESLFECFERIASSYNTAEAVQETKESVSEDVEEVREDLEEAKERRTKLKNELSELKSDDDIVAARQQISNGREELRELGEEYAVNRIAEHLTERLHERFIEEVAGPLIDDASEIFQRITQEYDGIDHNDSFDDLDFEALRDGSVVHGSNELSRATGEQLFLALRFARIRQLDVSLPIVIDDAMTNFDPAHGARTFKTIAELAESHQVFFLTCHPEAIMLANSYGDPAQFWCLENGRFRGPADDNSAVYDLLSTNHSAESTF
jgi:uncharacterized protein YhaN